MMGRTEILHQADVLVNGQRAQDYGPPQVNFQRIADLWSPVFGLSVTPVQVALALSQLKVARLINSPDHEDSWIDAAGYIAIGGELATGSG
jgi:hypothetical protein